MKFVVSSSELQKHLHLVAGVAPAKSVLPIIQNIHFVLKDGYLILTATDLENTMQTSLSVSAEAGAGLSVALPPKIVQDTLKSLPEQPLTIWLVEGTNTIRIVSDNGEYKINGFSGLDFPHLPQATNTSSIRVPLGVLTRAVQKTIFAVSTDELRPAMTGIFFHFKPEGATFVATDAHRLVRYRRTDLRTENEISFILPHKALKQLISAAATSIDDVVIIEYNESNAFFRFGNNSLVCRLIDARFPDYENVIPQNSPNKVIVGKKDLLSTIRRLDIYSNKTTHLGRFKFTGNLLEVKAEDMDYANEAVEHLNCLFEGEEMEIGFNVQLMIDIVANVDTEDCVVEMDTPGRAAIIVPNEQEENENVLMLLMPVMLGVSY